MKLFRKWKKIFSKLWSSSRDAVINNLMTNRWKPTIQCFDMFDKVNVYAGKYSKLAQNISLLPNISERNTR